MKDILQWINASLTAVLVIVTTIYVYLTWRLVRENIALRESASRPTLGVALSLHDAHINIINLCIENVGGGPAHDIQLRTSSSFTVSGCHQLSDIGPFRKGITYLGPHQRFEFFLANAIGNFDQLREQSIEIHAEYSDQLRKTYKNTFKIDFGELEGITRLGTPPLFTIAESIQNLQKDFARLCESGRMKILVHTPADLERKKEEDMIEIESIKKRKLGSSNDEANEQSRS